MILEILLGLQSLFYKKEMTMKLPKTPVFIDLDNTVVDFSSAAAKKIEENPHNAYPQSEYGFFANLEPIEDAVASIQLLQKSKNYQPWILTAPSIKNPLCYTEKRVSVEKLLGMDMVRRLIISPDKSFFPGKLIDDNDSGNGQDRFRGDFIHFGSAQFPNWLSVINYLSPIV